MHTYTNRIRENIFIFDILNVKRKKHQFGRKSNKHIRIELISVLRNGTTTKEDVKKLMLAKRVCFTSAH